MLSITVKVSGTKEVKAKLRKLGQELYMLQSAMTAIGDSLSKYYRDVGFSSQGGVFGGQWPRLSPAYAARKAKEYPGRPILVKTGKMQRSFEYDAKQTYVKISNEAPQFIYHQSTAPRLKLPRRAMMGVNGAVKKTVNEIVKREINAKLRRTGL